MGRLRVAAALLTVFPASSVQVTPQDVRAVEWKLTAMSAYFSATWNDFFINVDPRLYASPKRVSYSRSTNTACGEIGPGNAGYCSRDNTIYYDREFLAARMKAAAAALRTDGDYAPVVILAHEWGHAAAYWYRQQNRRLSWQTFAGEQLADCLAGAITVAAEKATKLRPGDLQEAEFEIQAGGAPIPSNFANSEVPGLEKLNLDPGKLVTHGEPADRLRAFRKGYREMAPRCWADLKLGGYGRPAAPR